MRQMGIAVLAAGCVLLGGSARAMTYRPISDENLVAASDLVVVGTVARVASARLATGRIVTQTEIRVGDALKGRVAGGRILVTEPGGRVGGVTVRIPGVPAFAPGERTLVFLRERTDGTLGTTALSLAKYTIPGDAPGRARRTVPDLDDRSLAAFDARIRSLAAASPGRTVRDGFGGPAPVEVNVHVDGFTLLAPGVDCDPTLASCEGALWFEALCDVPIVYSLSGSDAFHGPVVSRQAFEDALRVWSSAVGGFLDLEPGPDVPTVPPVIRGDLPGDFDGLNVVQFEDPFEIVSDLVGCQGVLALGGSVTLDGGFVAGNTTFQQTIEAEVVMNDGAGACISASGVAETVAHEIGHTLGFGHSSEDPNESDAALLDAIMYFAIKDDGRGARLGSDDLAAMAFAYPPPVAAPTPAGAALRNAACLFDMELWSGPCFVDQAELNGFPAAPIKRFRKAGRLAVKAYGHTKPKKQVKLLGKADRLLGKSEAKLTALQSDGTVRPACATPLLDRVGLARQRVVEARTLLEATL